MATPKQEEVSLPEDIAIKGQGTEPKGCKRDSAVDSPKRTTSLLSILLFWWMNKTLDAGNKNALRFEDLSPPLQADKADVLTGKISTEWAEQVATARDTTRRPQLWKAIAGVIPVKSYVALISLRLLAATTNAGLVMLSWFYLRSLSEPSGADILGSWLYITGIGVVSLVRAICVHHSDHQSEVWGIRLRAALIGIVYKKMLTITRQALENASSLNAINLISNDAGKLEKSVFAFGLVLSALVELVASIFIFGYLISWRALTGAVTFVVVVVYIVLIAGKMADFRRKAAAYTDRRLAVMSEVIAGIRTVKMRALEEYFKNKIYGLRRKEMSYIRRKGTILSSFVALKYTTTSIAAYVSVTILVALGIQLEAFPIFTLLLGFNLMKNAVCYSMADSLRFLVDVHIALKRVQTFLEQGTLEPRSLHSTSETTACDSHEVGIRQPDSSLENRQANSNPAAENGDLPGSAPIRRKGLPETSQPSRNVRLSIANISSRWTDSSSAAVDHVSMGISGSDLVVVTGVTGSGKSSMLLSVLDELPLSDGHLRMVGRVAYVAQTPWLFSGTLRDNIIFGRPFNQKLYDQVLEACDLQSDLKMLARGDCSPVGENGSNLSGGQRARVSLARALYSEGDIYLLDDPISALDTQVSDRIFEKCICGMLANRLRILVTHQVQYVHAADHIVVMDKGSLMHQDSPRPPPREKSRISVHQEVNELSAEEYPRRALEDTQGARRGSASPGTVGQTPEQASTGSVSLKSYWLYLTAGIDPLGLGFLVLFLCFSQVCVISPSWWLSRMSNMSIKQQQDAGTLTIYGSLVVAALMASTLSAFCFYYVLMRASKVLYERLSEAVIKSPASFFDNNPAGRVLNRCSRDIGLIDDQLPPRFLRAAQTCLFTLGAIFVPVGSNVWMIIAVLPFIAVFLYYGRFYLKSARELKRLEGLKCSPVYSHFNETHAGLEIIRSSNAESQFLREFYRFRDENTQVSQLVVASARWMGIRLEILCALFVTLVAIGSLVIGNDPALAGLSLTFAVETLGSVQYVARSVAQVENLMTSVERVLEYTELDAEPGYSVSTVPPYTWPKEGRLELRGVRLSYKEGDEPVLKGLSVRIEARQKVGVVGRTGAGKSSIVAALSRMPDPQGQVLIDGVDLGTLNLQAAREAVTVISQEPVLFSGSLRGNLDPLGLCTDAQLWSALEQVGMKSQVQQLPGRLQFSVTEAGSNFSVGQRQLLCLARALTLDTEILILDEPTANVDFQTDQAIQQVIQQHFEHCTVLTIAHRLHTVMSCDRLLVMDGGRVAEFDDPKVLVEKPGGLFNQMFKTYRQTMERERTLEASLAAECEARKSLLFRN